MSLGLHSDPVDPLQHFQHFFRSQIRSLRQSRILRVVMVIFVLVALVRLSVVPIKVSGDSMYPTYHDGALRLMNKWSYAASLVPHRGDVVVVEFPAELMLKRILGMPGETVSTRKGKILVDGKLSADKVNYDRVPYTITPYKLRTGEYFVVGDNREVSVFARVDKGQIKGKLLF
jgi:signal peptidase I